MQVSSLSLAFKIRDRKTSLFKMKGGRLRSEFAWNKVGDIYATEGRAVAALRAILTHRADLKGRLEIVAFEMKEVLLPLC